MRLSCSYTWPSWCSDNDAERLLSGTFGKAETRALLVSGTLSEHVTRMQSFSGTFSKDGAGALISLSFGFLLSCGAWKTLINLFSSLYNCIHCLQVLIFASIVCPVLLTPFLSLLFVSVGHYLIWCYYLIRGIKSFKRLSGYFCTVATPFKVVAHCFKLRKCV